MNLSNILPTYSFIIKNRHNNKFRFGTRRLYVDLPYLYYHFMFKIPESEIIDNDSIKTQFNNFIKQCEDEITFNKRPLANIYCVNKGKPTIIMRLNIKYFLKYLDEKAKNVLNEIKEGDTQTKIREFYSRINFNFLMLTGLRVPTAEITELQLLKFNKCMKIIGDYYAMKESIDYMKKSINSLQSIAKKKRVDALITLYLTPISILLEKLYISIMEVDVRYGYLVLRHIVENLIEACAGLIICDKRKESISNVFSYNVDYTLTFLYCINKYATDNRIDIDNCIETGIKDILIVQDNKWEIDKDVLNKSKLMPININTKNIRDFIYKYIHNDYKDKLSKIINIYSLCSYIIHNKPSLPFLSILEMKFFRYFLEWYAEISYIIEYMIRLLGSNESIPRFEPKQHDYIDTLKAYNYIISYIDANRDKCYEIVKDAFLQNKILYKRREELSVSKRLSILLSIDPFTFVSILRIFEPSTTSIKKNIILPYEINDAISKISKLTCNTFLEDKWKYTLEEFQYRIIPKIEMLDESFKEYPEDVKKLVALYLLVIFLPDIVGETFGKLKSSL